MENQMKKLIIIGAMVFMFAGCHGNHAGIHIAEHVAAELTEDIVHEVVGNDIVSNVAMLAITIGILIIL